MSTHYRTRVLLLVFSVQTGASLLSAEALPFQKPSGPFVLPSVTSPSTTPVTNAPANASFNVATPGYFLFSGTGAGLNTGATVTGTAWAGSTGFSSIAPSSPSFGSEGSGSTPGGSVGLALTTYSVDDSDTKPLSAFSSSSVPGDLGVAEVPEPGTLVLVGIGVVLIGIWKNASRVRA